MRRFLAGILVALVAVAIAAQLALPHYLSGRTEDRLGEGGGSSKSRFARSRLSPSSAAGAGRSRSRARACRSTPGNGASAPSSGWTASSGCRWGSTTSTRERSRSTGSLERDGRHEAYQLVVRATTTPRELAGELGSEAGGALGGRFGSLASGILPGGARDEVPLELRATVDSAGGRTNVRHATGSVAGLPAGPLTEVVVSAVLDRL